MSESHKDTEHPVSAEEQALLVGDGFDLADALGPPDPEPTVISLGRNWVLGAFSLAAILLGLCLIFGVRLLASSGTFPGDPPGSGLAQQNASLPPQDDCSLRAQVDMGAMPFEESLGAPLEETVKRLDYALIESVSGAGLSLDALDLEKIEERTGQGQHYLFQTIHVALTGRPDALVKGLAARVATLGRDAKLVRLDPITWQLSVAGLPTHRLTLSPPQAKPVPPPAEGHGRLCIVIDDLGENLEFAQELAALDFPVTFAIWPKSSMRAEVAAVARDAGLEIIVHQPMQPENPRANPGPGALYTNMDDASVRNVLTANLDRIPDAVGMNNHMGSAFTQYAQGMAVVITELHSRGMFILDSLTHAKSQVVPTARGLDTPVYRRDVFLDVVQDVDAIVFQLEKSQRLALAKGRAVAIGHPHPETLEALKQWGAKRSKRLDLVALHQMSPLNPVAVAEGN